MSSWQHAASSDAKVIVNWYKGLYKGHGVGIATGQESGVWVLDIDTGPDKPGDASLTDLEQTHGQLPATVEAVTGSGGRHLYFVWPDGERVVTRRDTKNVTSPLPAGIDVRGEGGQVLAPPTVHPNGTTYAWRDGHSPWDREVAEAPEWLLQIVCEREAPTPPASPTEPSGTFLRDDGATSESIAGWFDQTEHWDTLLLRDGWTPMPAMGDQQYWVRPGKEKRDGHSAVLHLPDGPFVIFSTDGSLAKYAEPSARVASGDGWAFSKFGYHAVSRHGGDRSEAARQLRDLRTERERYAAPAVEGGTEPAAPKRSLLNTGAEFVLDHDSALEPIWGTPDQVLWVKGEPLLIVAPTGVGKTTVAIQIAAAQLGLGPPVLGLPVEDDGSRVLYLAMDRPRQIARAMARVFGEQHRDVLAERMVVWRGPLPSDLGKRPETLVELCQQANCQTVYIDSLKDAAVKLSDDEVGGNLNRAIQMCIVEEVQVCGLHHQRKRMSGGEKPKTIDDIYGSVWIPGGAGSVVLLWGSAGDPIVELVHLKQPADEVGPWRLEHDHHAGRTTIFHSFDPLAFLRNRGDYGATPVEAARAMEGKESVTDNQRKKAQRLLDGLVRRDLATRSEVSKGGAGGSEGVRYRAVDNPLGATDKSNGQGVSEQSNGQATDTTDISDESPAQSNGQDNGQQRTARATDTVPPITQGDRGRDTSVEEEIEPPF